MRNAAKIRMSVTYPHYYYVLLQYLLNNVLCRVDNLVVIGIFSQLDIFTYP